MTLSLIFVTILILFFAAGELLYPKSIREGFTSIIPVLSGKPNFFSTFVPKRGDVTIDNDEPGFKQDPRYFRGYADVQRLGVEQDFCRLVKEETSGDIFFACALAGTENLSSVKFRTPSVKEGFRLSRDDYMNKGAYCRILKYKDGSYQPLCNKAGETEFNPALVVDGNPPADIQTLVSFYKGCILWLRLRDDMVDYVNNVKVYKVGGLQVEEFPPNPDVTRGLEMNGIDQYIRLGDNQDLELGSLVPLRSMRALMIWVYFDEFTNNAHFVDFGNGAGRDNIVLGILGKGDPNMFTAGDIRPPLLCGGDSTLPDGKSGAQPVPEDRPQDAMENSRANVDAFTCQGFEDTPRRLPPSRVNDVIKYSFPPETATLLYEVWDQQQRKLRIKIPGAIPKKTWTHICVTAKSMDSFRPDIAIYINGKQEFLEPSGWLPQASYTSNNYLGKSNWENETSQFENKDALFKGSLFDFRAYKVNLSDDVIKNSIAWGKEKLGILNKEGSTSEKSE